MELELDIPISISHQLSITPPVHQILQNLIFQAVPHLIPNKTKRFLITVNAREPVSNAREEDEED